MVRTDAVSAYRRNRQDAVTTGVAHAAAAGAWREIVPVEAHAHFGEHIAVATGDMDRRRRQRRIDGAERLHDPGGAQPRWPRRCDQRRRNADTGEGVVGEIEIVRRIESAAT